MAKSFGVAAVLTVEKLKSRQEISSAATLNHAGAFHANLNTVTEKEGATNRRYIRRGPA